MALAAYRNLLRSARIAFRDDYQTLIAAKQQARQGFEQDRQLHPGSDEPAKRVHFAQDVARILRENVIQGKAKTEDPSIYKLNIHEHTELGNNDSVNTTGSKKTSRSNGQACCSA